MSGQPNLNPSDPLKFREQYLANLALRVKLDDKNLQANKIYKRTGQTPSIVKDNRTTSEKLADLQRLGVEIRADLKEIMDGPTAEKVVSELDSEGLQFLGQHIKDIIMQLKPKYKYGVPFVTFMTFFASYWRTSAESNDYIAGLQQKSGRDILLGINQILENMVDKELLDMVQAEMDEGADRRNGALIGAIRRDIADLEGLLVTRTDYMEFLRQGDQRANMEIFARINDAMEELPTRAQIREFLANYQRAVDLNDGLRQSELLQELNRNLTVPPEVLEQLQLVKNEITSLRREGADQTRAITGEMAERRKEEAALMALSATLSIGDKGALTERRRDMSELVTRASRRKYITEMIELDQLRGPQTRKSIYKAVTGRDVAGIANLNEEEEQAVIAELNRRVDILTSPYPMPRNLIKPPAPAGEAAEEPFDRPTGSGVKRGRPKGSGVKGKGIQRDPNVEGIEKNPNRYATFGRFRINTHKLNDDIITLKRPTGCNVDGIPVRRVSKELGNVMRTIVGGGHPEYRHLDKLSDEEKVYLAKIAKKADIEDRLNVPTPSRDDDEKDVHQFEVMKGEIMSGNDNVEMVKKFKLLIMKLSRKEMLPKNQAKDIMMDLATLGY